MNIFKKILGVLAAIRCIECIRFAIIKSNHFSFVIQMIVFGVLAFLLLKPKKATTSNQTQSDVNSPNVQIDELTNNEKPKLIYSDDNILQQDIDNHIRIIDDSLKIIQKTNAPDVFFSRYALIIERVEELINLLKNANRDYDKALKTRDTIINKKQACIRDFIKRYWEHTYKKISELKTEKAKENNKQKFIDSLKPYEYEMDEESKKYYISICNITL